MGGMGEKDSTWHLGNVDVVTMRSLVHVHT